MDLSGDELEAAEASAQQGEVVQKTRRTTKAEKAKIATARSAKRAAAKPSAAKEGVMQSKLKDKTAKAREGKKEGVEIRPQKQQAK